MRLVPCEIYSRVCGFFRPVDSWNIGKRKEFGERKLYNINESFRGMLRVEGVIAHDRP
jgi:hypothetical protein